MDVVRVGIAGSGYMARTYAETTSKYNQGARLLAVAGGRRAAALAADYGIAVEPSVAALVNRKDIDAVILATPEQVRLEYTRLAAAAGKHILSEKPMAPTVAECDEMIAVCQQAGVMLGMIQTARYRGVQARAKQLIDEGRIGKVWMIRNIAVFTQSEYKDAARDKPFLTDPAGGGFFYDQGVHNFDLLRWLTGQEPKQVFARVDTFSGLPWQGMSAMAQIHFDGGAVAQVTICLEMPDTVFPASSFRFQVIGDRGLLDFDMYEHLDLGVDGRWERVWTQPKIDYLHDPNSPVRLEAHAAVTQEFISALRENRPMSVTAADGRAAVAVCEACIRSARTGQVVAL